MFSLWGGGRLIAQKDQPKYLRENDKSFKEMTARVSENGWIEFKKEAKINPNSFFKDYANSLGLGQHYDFKPLNEQRDEKGRLHQRFQLHYKNIPVEGMEFSLHTFEDGTLQTAHGRIVEGIDTDVSKPITERRALEIALADKKLTFDDFKEGESKLPRGTLLLAKLSPEFIKENYRLAYAFSVYGKSTFDAHRIYVDTQTGEIIKRSPLIRQCFHHHLPNEPCSPSAESAAPPTASTAPLIQSTFVPNRNRYLPAGQNVQTFETQNFNGGFRLSMNVGGVNPALHTRIDQAPFGLWDNNDIEIQSPTTVFGQTDAQGRDIRNATTAHWTVWRMHEFFQNRYGRNGVDKNGNISRILVDMDLINAFWNTDNIIRLGFGPEGGIAPSAVTNQTLRDNNRPLAVLDITAHEYMHGVTHYSAGLTTDTGYESGSLDEGLSDIFGTVMERNLLPNNWNWTIGEDSWGIRNLANPTTSLSQAAGYPSQPDRYLGPNWQPNGRHQNNGVLNKWFHSICTGQNPHANNIQAIDFDKATNIVYRALDLYLQSYAGYFDMREATIMAARDLYGTCSFEEVQVTNAWAAANVGATFANVCGNNSPIAPGCYALRAKHSNKYLQVVNNNDNTQLVQNAANGNANQIFRIDQPTNYDPTFPTYRLISQSSFKFLRSNGSGNGSPLVQRFYNNNEQFDYRWAFGNMGNGYYFIHRNGKSIDIAGVSQADGAGATIWDSHFGDNQLFSLESRTCPTGPQNDCNFGVTTNANDTNPPCGSTITLSSSCNGSCSGVSYNWSGNGLNANTASTSVSLPTQGSYTYILTASKPNCPTQQSNITITVYQVAGGCGGTSCPNVGSISYQRWENIGGGTGIQDLRNNTNNLNNGPSTTQTLSLFEAPSDVMDNYGVRIRGYVCPPTTGNYTFWIAGDDNVELWISPNDQPSGLSRIAYHNAWTPSREWGWFGTQQSAPIALQAGQRYYVEALMKEGSGGDNLAVGWQLPNGSLERPIPGNRLIPFAGGGGSSCNFSVAPSTSNGTPSCGASVTLNANCSGSDCGGVSYTWSGNGLSSSNSSVSTNVPSSNGTYTYTVTASKSGCGNQTGSVNVTVSGCSGGGGSLNQCIESESSSGSGAITSDPNASNGSTRGEENNYNHYVDYVVTSVPSAGTYYVKLRYYSSAAPTIGVQINGGGSSNISLPSSGSWNIVWAEHTFTVSLLAGTNTIRIQGVSGGSCRQDRICVSSNPPRIGLEKESLSTDMEASILELYPNPTGGKVTVQYYLEKGQKASLQFINANGQVLLQKALTGEGGWQKTQTDLSEQPEGSYAVRMETQEKIVSRKFLIIK